MSRIFWDSMLFIYMVEDDAQFAPIVRDVLGRCFRRGDSLHTSHLSIAETLVGIPRKSEKEARFLSVLDEMEFSFVEFGSNAVEPFRILRKEFGLKPPDALNLSCAAAIQADMYLTNDTELLKKKLHVPGIDFIADFKRAPL